MVHKGWRLASVIVAALVGGYCLANVASIFVAVALPLTRSEATLLANILSFAFYVLAIMWAFSQPTQRRAWLGLLIPAAVLFLLGYLLGGYPL